MGGKSNTDYGEVAATQGEENRAVVRDQLQANRPDQYTPWGYSNWQTEQVPDGQGGMTEKWSNTQGLTPELQEMLNKQMALSGSRTDLAGGLSQRMASEFGEKLDYGGMNPLAGTPQAQYTLPENYEGIAGVGDPTAMRQRAEEGYMGKAESRLGPQFDSKRQAMEIKLRNQGLSPGDEAYNSQMEGLGQQETDAYGQAQYDAIRAGLGEQSQLFNQGMGMRQQGVGEANNQFQQALGSNAQNYGQNMQGANYSNQIRQQQQAEAQSQRGQSLNEMNALLSGQQVGMPNMPNFQTANAAQPAPYMQGAAQNDSMNAAQSPWNSVMGLAGSLGGGALQGWASQ